MQEGYWVVRTYEAGAVGEKTKFFVQGSRPTGKIRRKDRDAARKQEQNEYSAQKALARLRKFCALVRIYLRAGAGLCKGV